MFELLRTRVFSKLEEEGESTAAAGELLAPPASWVPPLGASARTWANILKNKNNIDYCTSQFHYLGTRYVARVAQRAFVSRIARMRILDIWRLPGAFRGTSWQLAREECFHVTVLTCTARGKFAAFKLRAVPRQRLRACVSRGMTDSI